MSSFLLFGIAAVAFAVAAVLTRRFLAPDSVFHILDQPTNRSLHSQPVPRTGGVALLVGFLAASLAAYAIFGLSTTALWITAIGCLLGMVSFIEDRFGLARRYRLAAHLLAALALLPAGLVPTQSLVPGAVLPLPMIAIQFAVLLGTVWMINLYNFMDGMDGFAGGMAVFGFGALGVAGWLHGSAEFALINFILAASAAGFLLFNFPAPKARIFMGDAGSTALGFFAAACVLWAEREGILPLWAGLLVFSPFIVDASVTLARRLWRREKIWLPHKTHYYQRFVQLGWGHRKTVLRGYLLMLVCAGAALQGARSSGRDDGLWLLAMCGALYGLIAFKVHLLERMTGRN